MRLPLVAALLAMSVIPTRAANVNIGQLPDASTLSGTELLDIFQNGHDRKVNINALSATIAASLLQNNLSILSAGLLAGLPPVARTGAYADLSGRPVAGVDFAVPVVSYTGTATPTILPAGPATVCLAAGQVVVLPTGARTTDVVSVSDCSLRPDGSVALLTTPELVNTSSDTTIAGAASYQLTLSGQSVSFRKTPAGPWQPF